MKGRCMPNTGKRSGSLDNFRNDLLEVCWGWEWGNDGPAGVPARAFCAFRFPCTSGSLGPILKYDQDTQQWVEEITLLVLLREVL